MASGPSDMDLLKLVLEHLGNCIASSQRAGERLQRQNLSNVDQMREIREVCNRVETVRVKLVILANHFSGLLKHLEKLIEEAEVEGDDATSSAPPPPPLAPPVPASPTAGPAHLAPHQAATSVGSGNLAPHHATPSPASGPRTAAPTDTE